MIRKRGHAILLVRVRMPARVSVRVGRRVLKARRPAPCRTVAIRLPGRHGKARLSVSIKRGTERRTVPF